MEIEKNIVELLFSNRTPLSFGPGLIYSYRL